MPGSQYTIQELCREFEVTPRTLRFYETKKLLAPARRGTTRLYSDRDRTRLRLTLRGTRLGFSLEECREIIDLYDVGGDGQGPRQDHARDDLRGRGRAGNARQLLRLCDKIREHRMALLQKLRDIEATLASMGEVESRCLAELLEIDRNVKQASR